MNAERVKVADAAKGWLHPEEGPALNAYASQCVGPFVEIGSYCGKSTVWIGDAAEHAGTVLFAIDHHRGNPEMRPGNDCHDPEVLDADGRHDTLPVLRLTLATAGLEDVVIPVAAASHTLAPHWNTQIGFLFIDGGHDAISCQRDADQWTPWIRPGGIVVFHDATIVNIGHVVDGLKGFTSVEQIGCMRILVKE